MYERTYKHKVLSQKSTPEKKRRRRFPWRRAFMIAIGVVALAIVVTLIRLPQLRVRDVEVVGTSVVDPEDVSLFIKSKIEGNWLYVFPKASMLLIPTSTVSKWIARQFPRFANIDVRRKGLHGLIVSVTEHTGKYLWCANNSDCYFMTDQGLVFAQAPFFSGDAYPRIYIGAAAELPFSPLTASQLSLVQLLLDRLPTIGINPSAFYAPSEHEVDVIFSHNGADAKLILDPANAIDQTLENLATALSTEPLRGKFKSDSGMLEYIDVRFANKVVYKFN